LISRSTAPPDKNVQTADALTTFQVAHKTIPPLPQTASTRLADSPRLARASQGNGLTKGPGLLRLATQTAEVIHAEGNLAETAEAWRSGSVALPDHLGFQTQPDPQFESDSFCPTKGGVGLTLGCVLAGITVIDRKLREKKKAAPKRSERRVVGQEQIEQVGQIVSAGYGRAELLQKRL
jgi:hypothetical protein